MYHRCVSLTVVNKFVVRYDYKRIHIFSEEVDSKFCLSSSLGSLKGKRFGYNTNREYSHILRSLGNDRCSSRSGSAAHAGCDEHHIRSVKLSGNLVECFLCSLLANLWIRSGSESSRKFFANLNLRLSQTSVQGLSICINSDKVNSLKFGFHHAVYCVASAAADTNDFNHRSFFHVCFKL